MVRSSCILDNYLVGFFGEKGTPEALKVYFSVITY